MQFEETRISNLRLQERKVVSIALVIVIILGVHDFIEDISQGINLSVIIFDVIYVSTMFGLLIYIWIQVPLSRKRQIEFLSKQRDQQREDAKIWKEQAKDLLLGLGKMIDQQFTDWQLSDAEKLIGLLLLKGFSLKEIAEMRGTKDLTTRQQAANIYQKAKLSGRNELSAFFLEDLLLPMAMNEEKYHT